MKKSNLPAHTGHRKRLRQRIHTAGTDSLLDHEMLEVLLTYAIARKDTKPLAWALLKRFGSVAQVLDASEAALASQDGIGPRTIQLLKLVRSLFKRYARANIPRNIDVRNSRQVIDYCQISLAGNPEEFLELIFVSSRYTIMSTRIIASGTINTLHIKPRQILEYALQEKAFGIIVVHNHPSGNPEPSPDDIVWTQHLDHAASWLEIKLIDHVIVARHAYFSCKEQGYLN